MHLWGQCGVEQHKAPKREKENAHRAAGNLLISANYFWGAWKVLCQRIGDQRQGRQRFPLLAAAAAESKTNKDCDNRSPGIVNPGGAVFNPHSSFKQSDGFILKL